MKRKWKPFDSHPMKDGARFRVKMSDGSTWYAEFWAGPPGLEREWGGVALDCTPGFCRKAVPDHGAKITHWSALTNGDSQ